MESTCTETLNTLRYRTEVRFPKLLRAYCLIVMPKTIQFLKKYFLWWIGT